MAAAGKAPVLANPIVARAAMEQDLVKVLHGRGVTWEESGWRRIHDHGLLIPVTGYFKEVADAPDFLLRLEFFHYPDWPPSAQFVNPATGKFVIGQDGFWLPKIDCDEIKTHENYGSNQGQVICSSVTLEFYTVLHSVEEKHVWKHPRQNFAATLNQIEWALRHHYHGRFAAKAAA